MFTVIFPTDPSNTNTEAKGGKENKPDIKSRFEEDRGNRIEEFQEIDKNKSIEIEKKKDLKEIENNLG